jgi:RNA polymerase sigma factor (sigma-70 family)
MARYQRRERHDPRYCYQLFRRALAQRDEEAWAAVYEQYCRLVNRWLGHVPGDPDALVNQVFTRFWKVVHPDRFDEFSSLGAILAYLKRCAQSIAIDARRQEERKQAKEARLFQMHQAAEEQSSSIECVLDKIVSGQVYEHVMKRLNSTQESLAFRASFEWGLKPAEIAKRWTAVFANAQEVSRIKERVLRRLRRDSELIEWLEMTGMDGVESV